MSGLFGGPPKAPVPPAIKPIAPIPTVGEEVGTEARKKRPRGFRETFLTGDLVPVNENLKKKKFGGG